MLTAFRQRLRVSTRTKAVHIGGLTLLVAGSLWAAPAIMARAPLSGTGWLLLAAVSAVPAVRSLFRIVAERRRVADDQAERDDKDAARWEAYHRWCHKLSDKPSDTEMAAWLESDRKVLVDRAMRQYRLQPSHVIAHTFIEAPAPSCKRARYPQGPWRYSRYRLLLFLLTDDGVRQANIDLDFETAASHTTQRLNYRFDAVAAVRIDGIATGQQTFELTLFNGEPISIRVSERDNEALQHDEDATKIAELSLDAAGLNHTLHVLEGVAAEGKEWIKHRRRRADERLANLAGSLQVLLDKARAQRADLVQGNGETALTPRRIPATVSRERWTRSGQQRLMASVMEADEPVSPGNHRGVRRTATTVWSGCRRDVDAYAPIAIAPKARSGSATAANSTAAWGRLAHDSSRVWPMSKNCATIRPRAGGEFGGDVDSPPPR